MRQFFYKSGMLISVIIVFSFIMILCGVCYFNAQDVYKPIPGMTEDYYLIQRKNGNQISDYKVLFEKETDYIVKGVKLEEGCAVDFNQNPLELEIVDGRLFTENEKNNKEDVIMVKEELLPLCSNANGKKYFELFGVSYQVVGIYKSTNPGDSRDNNYLINLWAKSLDETRTCSYAFCQGNPNLDREGFTYNNGDSARMILDKNVLSSYQSAIALYAGIAIYLFVNVFSVIYIWIRGRRKEIAIRKMVGAKKRQIYFWIIRDYMIYVVCGFGSSILLAYIFIFLLNEWRFSDSLMVLLGEDLEIKGVFMAFFVAVFICLVAIFGCVKKYLSNSIFQIIRQE